MPDTLFNIVGRCYKRQETNLKAELIVRGNSEYFDIKNLPKLKVIKFQSKTRSFPREYNYIVSSF